MPSFGGRKLQREHIENLSGFLTAVRQHEWDLALPAGAMIFPEDYPKRGERLPRALAEHVMAQIEAPASLDRWDDPARRLITLILIRAGCASATPASCHPTASSATATGSPTCATTTTR